MDQEYAFNGLTTGHGAGSFRCGIDRMIDMFSLTSGIPSYYKGLLASGDRLVARSSKFIAEIEGQWKSSENNIKSVPPNATIRLQEIKCGKPLCPRCPHGPFYYAYWKENRKLKKKYIGTKYDDTWKKPFKQGYQLNIASKSLVMLMIVKSENMSTGDHRQKALTLAIATNRISIKYFIAALFKVFNILLR
jgi:hypothetical protein